MTVGIICASNKCEHDTSVMESGNVYWNNRGANVIYACPECGNCVLLVYYDEEE